MTYYLERFTRQMGTEVLTIKADTWQEAVELAKRLHAPRMYARAALLWDNAHRCIATLGESGLPPQEPIDNETLITRKKPQYYGNLFGNLDD